MKITGGANGVYMIVEDETLERLRAGEDFEIDALFRGPFADCVVREKRLRGERDSLVGAIRAIAEAGHPLAVFGRRQKNHRNV